MVLDELLHVVLREIISLDVGLHELLVGDGSQVRQLLQLHEELLEVQLHQRAALVAALLHVSVAAGQRQAAVISIFSSRRVAPSIWTLSRVNTLACWGSSIPAADNA